jgi:hypothetical protein
LCADFSDTPCSSTPTETVCMGLGPVQLGAMKILPQIAQNTGSTELSPWKRNEESKFATASARSGTCVLKQGWIHWNITSCQERTKFIIQQTEVNVRHDCTADECGAKYSNTQQCIPCCTSLLMQWVGFSEAQNGAFCLLM